MVMTAKRFLASLMLLMLVGNILVYASPSSENSAKTTGQAFTLVSLKHESVGAMTRILLESNVAPQYTISRPTEKLLVIDLSGGESAQLMPLYTVKSSAVDTIAVRKSHVGSASTSSTSRFVGSSIEIALQENVQDRSKLSGNTLIIELVADKGATRAQSLVGPISIGTIGDNKGATTVQSSAKPGVYVEPVPVQGNSNVQPTSVNSKAEPRAEVASKIEKSVTNTPEPEKTQPVSGNLKAATIIRDVRSEVFEGGARIVIDTDGTAPYKNFSLESPYRIVVDITGVRSQVGNKTLTVGAVAVDKVRVGQPSANVVRIVVDAKTQAPYRVDREGALLVITVGNLNAAKSENSTAKSVAELAAAKAQLPALDAKSENAEVKVAGQRIDKQAENAATANATPSQTAKAGAASHTNIVSEKPAATTTKNVQPNKPATTTANNAQANKPSVTVNTPVQSAKPAISENSVAQANKVGANKSGAETRPRVSNQPNTSTPAVSKPAVREQISQPTTQPASVRSVMDTQRPTQSQPVTPTPAVTRVRPDAGLCEPNYVGGPISFDLRSGVDIRDMLRFVSQQYGVNFIVDKSVTAVPVDIRVNDLPWNYVLDSVLRANRLGLVCDKGRIVRIASLTAIKEEEDQQLLIAQALSMKVPLVTKIIHLRYARVAGQLGGESSGSGSRTSGGGSSSGSGGSSSTGGLLKIAEKRLSQRGRIEMDTRTNSLIIADLPEYVAAVEDIITKLDKPEPQVEIEARIVIASRNFLRDIGVVLAAGATGSRGKAGVFQTTPVQFSPGGITPSTGSGSGSSGGGSGGGDGGTGSGSGSTTGIGPNLIGPLSTGTLASGAANSVLSLTTGIFGTGIISAALTANETKGQIRTIASPRITTTDNKTAEIINGVQIPVQTVSNNTITTTFVTAALRLQITPQIIVENGEVLMKVVAENNTVNTAIANSFNGGTPGINTQSAESTVLVPDGGTTVMGGINIDNEGHSVNRTPGVSRIPVIGELFKRRSTNRNFDEILFFITPRIIRNDNIVKPQSQGLAPLDGRVTTDAPPAKTTPKKN
jgi:type IV pilus assembly protein PilQ